MRQASWNEMFAPKPGALVIEAETPKEPKGWRRFFWWEDIVTFALLGALVLAVISSVYRAEWVDIMPSLYPVTFFGLLMGAMLARVRWPEAMIHVLALPVGAVASLATILSIVPGATPWDRYEELHARMAAWFDVAFNGGISADELPFVVLVVPLAWIASYLSSWAVFRWQNVWLALVPSGFLLLSNVSYFSGQFSFAVVVFLFAAVLLITRVNLTARAKTWREEDKPYPPFLSLTVLHTTFWLAIIVLAAAWVMPRAGESGALESAWVDATEPVAERAAGLSRLFVGVRGPQESLIHRYPDIVPFQGPIELPETKVLEAIVEQLEQRRYLRAQSYDIYGSEGWELSAQREADLDANTITQVDDQLEKRQPYSVSVTSEGNTEDTAFTIGQPRRVNRDAVLEWSLSPEQISRVQVEAGLRDGSTYETVGSISEATADDLRAASQWDGARQLRRTPAGVLELVPGAFSGYPDALMARYAQLPGSFYESETDRLRQLAVELAEGESSVYDVAFAIEGYLRQFPIDYDIPETPRFRDTVDYFLFDLQRGYFDYHASAMVVMLRTLGVPSRLAVGYVLDPSERVPGTNQYRVTEQSAFAWPEVYFPGYGWIEFNPTPNQPRIERPDSAAVEPPTEAESGEAPSLGLEDLPGQFGEEDATGSTLDLDEGSSGGSGLVITLWVLAGLGMLALVAVGLGRFMWTHGLAGVPLATRRWEQTARLASWSGNGPKPTQTPHEFASAIADKVRGIDDVQLLADAYVREEFGDKDVPVDERLDQAWEKVRNGLVRRIFRLR